MEDVSNFLRFHHISGQSIKSGRAPIEVGRDMRGPSRLDQIQLWPKVSLCHSQYKVGTQADIEGSGCGVLTYEALISGRDPD